MQRDPILQIGAEGLASTDEKMQSLINRIVNAETPGFRSSDVTIRSFPLELEAAEKKLSTQSPKVDGTFYNYAQGTFVRTGKNTDFAIGTPGFFVLFCPWGEGYSRDGRFMVNPEGEVVTVVGGYKLMGQNGPILVSPGSRIDISETGELLVDSEVVDKIRVVDFEDNQSLESLNGVIFKDPTGNLALKEVDNPKILQGYVESSNASVVDQMVEMIYINRIYDTNTKIIQTRDGNLSQAIGMGRVQ
ncbi:hypothetical protein A2526_04585 [candidate division WOR-1 bacterium RIFOXYD2_FULL_36_8]|uniref:Flagellar basal-body/hook protein C-terminal domain-containing protein n=1 Tax=candidate division WOR-1 bacterium RIFOXYB2_FULL_36_35 TaxID=1802578 RepID=A0A1F4S7G8_UNCSA|nr:MAG: hypothetical protein A2230_01715 [candidate division WOR-1 bacterium RIFOXYA2_FULL_36_21]OGC15675.1 MAG: hypothetical protein A2282_04330 [candidate division WOR-1 bacterium RIFOXYA12_FULL_36_13]OGC16327.1 MAG: hypothetical protein A2290_04440 [candidate division WOR-1 bacterium RIFOXYB2_FULL_36_35]OGC39086.1 MAG: hypothetical protein A2526_04585 [candidate division WOR-1 bacterium RIFOXYD2_FULL_36_8]